MAAVKTWDPRHPWAAGSGGTVWDGMAYDPALGLVYIGTGNAAPYNSHLGGRRGGDELYAASIIAIHAGDGTLAWYYQTTPGDRWDFDSTQKLVLADLELDGKRRRGADAGRQERLLLRARSRHGRASVRAALRLRELGPRHRSEDRASAASTRAPTTVVAPPWFFRARPARTAGSPWRTTRLRGVTFIPVHEAGNIMIETSGRRAGLVEGQFTTPAFPPEAYDPKAMRSLVRRPPAARGARACRSRPIPPRADSCALGASRNIGCSGRRRPRQPGTAACSRPRGGLVFQGDANGNFNAYAAGYRQEAWHRLRSARSMMAAPMTYAVNGMQYVAIVAGYGGGAVIHGLSARSRIRRVQATATRAASSP